MIRTRLILFLFHIFSINYLSAQVLTVDQDSIIRETLKIHLGKFGQEVTLNQGANSFFYLNKDTFFNPVGLHYVFKLHNGKATRIDHSYYHGGNFERYCFTFKNNVHLIGGYGLFTTNNNIETFDFATQEWNFVKSSGSKPNFIRGLIIRDKDNLYSIYNSKSGNNAEPDEYDNTLYKLDLNTFTWSKTKNLNPQKPDLKNKYYLKNFTVGILDNQVMIVSNDELKYLILGKEDLRLTPEIIDLECSENYIFFPSNNTQIQTKKVLKIDIEQIWNKHSVDAQKLILNPTLSDYIVFYWIEILVSIVGLVLFCLTILIWIKSKKNVSVKTVAKHVLYERFLNVGKNQLDIDELDSVLNIQHMETESRKLKRHRLLSEIKQIHPNLITTEKDETDKRRNIYKINP